MPKVFTITEGLENMGALRTGGQGSVYKARRYGPVITAVKLLPTPIYSESQDDRAYRDFQNEVEKLRKVNERPNPNVVRILSSGVTETGSFPFIEMEFIEGPDLEELLKPPHPPVFPISEVIRVADQLSGALAHCHRVGVRHGDIKSNNVKFNSATGNYVLLDFGLAVMSDEQRRTSLRQAGAIEFMAPEQSEGRMLYQTDVYSYGIILYELLAGRVPFPLRDRSEMARNSVMVAHLETAPADPVALRLERLPADWPEEVRQREASVPSWLLELLDRCLRKNPSERFADGGEVHRFIAAQRERPTVVQPSVSPAQAAAGEALRQENNRLKEENARLLLRLEGKDRELQSLQSLQSQRKEAPVYHPGDSGRQRSGKGVQIFLVLMLIGLAAAGFYLFLPDAGKKKVSTEETQPEPVAETPRTDVPIGTFYVGAQRAYFHNEPDGSTRRSAYLVPSEDAVTAFQDKAGFIYTEFTNSRGQTSRGWIRRADLITEAEWKQRQEAQKEPARLDDEEINRQLREADELREGGQIPEALNIYSPLSEAGVPEAMFRYADLSLKGQNNALECPQALSLLERASARGYVPAKRTLGFLYLFAKNETMMRFNNYERCAIEKNASRGSRLLMEAVLSGDTTARRLLDESNAQGDGNDDQ